MLLLYLIISHKFSEHFIINIVIIFSYAAQLIILHLNDVYFSVYLLIFNYIIFIFDFVFPLRYQKYIFFIFFDILKNPNLILTLIFIFWI